MRRACHSRIFSSTVSATMSRMTLAALVWPMREMRPAAWASMPGVSDGSRMTAVFACVSVSPAAPPPPAPDAPPKSGTRSTAAPPRFAARAKAASASRFFSGDPTSDATGRSWASSALPARFSSRVHAEKTTTLSPRRARAPQMPRSRDSLLPHSPAAAASAASEDSGGGASSGFFSTQG